MFWQTAGGSLNRKYQAWRSQVGQRNDVVPIGKPALDPLVGSGWSKIKAVVGDMCIPGPASI
jgi:hypothetical protein